MLILKSMTLTKVHQEDEIRVPTGPPPKKKKNYFSTLDRRHKHLVWTHSRYKSFLEAENRLSNEYEFRKENCILSNACFLTWQIR